MAQVKHHKCVAALPAELEADAIYYVRAGAGYDQYVTNSAGMIVAYPLNAPSAAASFFGLVTVIASATGQTEFAIPGGYTPGAIVVFLNGSSLAPAHYTATNGTNVVLQSGTDVIVGSELVVLRLSAFQVADALPLGGTAVDSNKLGGQLPEYYADAVGLAKARQQVILDVKSSGSQTIAQAFTTIAMPTVITDSSGGWNPATSTFTVPVTGLYLAVLKYRLNDAVVAACSYGAGIHTSNVDGPHFSWASTVSGSGSSSGAARNGLTVTRVARFQAGAILRGYAYVDRVGGLPTFHLAGNEGCGLSIVLLRAE